MSGFELERSKSEEIGERILRARRSRKQSQGWLAEQCEVVQSVVSEWERGRRLPKPDVLVKVAMILGVSYDWLISGNNEPPLVFSKAVADNGRLVAEDAYEHSIFKHVKKMSAAQKSALSAYLEASANGWLE